MSTTFRVLGRNDQIVIDRYDDPKVDGVSCYMSRAEKGGVKGSLGFATDPEPVLDRLPRHWKGDGDGRSLPDKEVVFGASANWLFKEIRVTRMWDKRESGFWCIWCGPRRRLRLRVARITACLLSPSITKVSKQGLLF